MNIKTWPLSVGWMALGGETNWLHLAPTIKSRVYMMLDQSPPMTLAKIWIQFYLWEKADYQYPKLLFVEVLYRKGVRHMGVGSVLHAWEECFICHMKTSRTIGDKERLCETTHYMINLLYLAIQVSKEQRKQHRDTNPVYYRTSHLWFHNHCKGGTQHLWDWISWPSGK